MRIRISIPNDEGVQRFIDVEQIGDHVSIYVHDNGVFDNVCQIEGMIGVTTVGNPQKDTEVSVTGSSIHVFDYNETENFRLDY